MKLTDMSGKQLLDLFAISIYRDQKKAAEIKKEILSRLGEPEDEKKDKDWKKNHQVRLEDLT